MLGLLAGLVLAAVPVVGIDVASSSPGSQAPRTELQGILDRLVSSRNAPGVTAYVSGPHGRWLGSAGVANIETRVPMRPDARMRIESNSKTWLAAVVLQLAGERKLSLDDTVARWLPGLLRGHGTRITIRELMHDTSGLIDDNDVWRATPAEGQAMLGRVRDAKLRAQLLTLAAKTKNPSAEIPALLFIRVAAWQPLVAEPGTTYHHSNIGWNVLGLIAAKAGGRPLPVLYRDRLFKPLSLRDTAFDAQGPIAGPHANGYGSGPDGPMDDLTASHAGKFADGAIVTNAQDEATFLHALMSGKLFNQRLWTQLYGTASGTTGCGAPAWAGVGEGNAYRSYVWFDSTGSRIAVLLLNKDVGNAAPAALRLYCAT